MSILASCAASAPQLPEDTTATNRQHSLSLSDFSANDLAMDCKAIQTEQSSNTAKINQDNDVIKSNRKQNQVAGYLGGMFLLPYAATESNSDEKEDIAKLQQRQDILIKLVAAKNCKP